MEALAQMLSWREPAITASKLPHQVNDGRRSSLPLDQAILQAVIRLDEAKTRKTYT
jgi:hypothetical protein